MAITRRNWNWEYKGNVYPSQKALSEALGCSLRKVSAMRKAGVVVRVKPSYRRRARVMCPWGVYDSVREAMIESPLPMTEYSLRYRIDSPTFVNFCRDYRSI